MDIGTKSLTEYDYSVDIINYKMANKDTLLATDKDGNLLIREGNIHSHNNMEVFFSGTDDQDLRDNVETRDYYLSVIINNDYDICARIAFKIVNDDQEREVVYTHKNKPVKIKLKEQCKKYCAYYEINEIDKGFKDERFDEVLEKEKRKKSLRASSIINPKGVGIFPGDLSFKNAFYDPREELAKWVMLDKNIDITLEQAFFQMGNSLELDMKLLNSYEYKLEGYFEEHFITEDIPKLIDVLSKYDNFIADSIRAVLYYNYEYE